MTSLAPRRFTTLDFLFCNAGVLNIKGFNWFTALKALVQLRFIEFLETGR